MPQINILNILQGDNQSTVVDKINYNFDQILSAGGGPQGQKGSAGATGPVGPQGPQGVQGSQGPSGTKWFVQDVTPVLGSISGSNPFLFPTLGDYWLDPASSDQDIYVYTSTGWADTGFGLAAGDIFQNLAPISIGGGSTGNAIMIAGASEDSTLVLSDSTISQYTPAGTPIQNLNWENSKLKISTKDARQKLISFGHSDFDIDPGGSAGSYSNYNPYFTWRSSVPGGKGFWDLEFANPTGSIQIKSPGLLANSGINLQSTAEISAQSDQDNVLLTTSSSNKGTFVDASSGTFGFFEVADSAKGINQTYPFLYVNSTGLGLGIGTGGFKLTGDDRRRLAVLGNVSVSTTVSEHNAALFTGNVNFPLNHNKGSFYVQGHAGFGRINPTGYEGGSVNITGPNELLGLYPQLWVTSPNYGPALQIKTLGGPTFTSRSVIGDGTIDFNFITSSGQRVSGTGPDFTQEFFSNGHTFTAGPLLSFQHKITDSSNTTGTANVFAITTTVNAGVYNNANSVNNTTIQTRNSNPNLFLQANSTGQYNSNMVALGTAGYSQLAVYPGPVTSSTTKQFGTTVIGYAPHLGKGLTGTLTSYASFSSVSLPSFDGTSGGFNKSSHALSILGVQTIGTTDPVSLLETTKNNDSPFGAVSMLKIHRNLGTDDYVPSVGYPTGITGTQINNWPNGLEITSFRSDFLTTTKGANNSVALAIGATNVTSIKGGFRTPCASTGFYVSDTGENAAIGTTIDPTVALSVSGSAVIPTAIMAYADVNITGGNLNVTGGNLNVTGTMRIESQSSPSQYTLTTQNSLQFRIENPSSSLMVQNYGFQARTNVSGDEMYLTFNSNGFEFHNDGVPGGKFVVRSNTNIVEENVVSWDVTSLSDPSRWVSNFSGTTTLGITWLGPLDTDVMVYGFSHTQGSSPSATITLEGIAMMARFNGFANSFTAIVPAGVRFAINIGDGGGSICDFAFRIQRFGKY